MSVSDNKKNRGAHGDSSFMLDALASSSENPPGFSRGECQLNVGDKAWLLPRGNAARGKVNLIEGEISRIGRVYFCVKHKWSEYRFRKDDCSYAPTPLDDCNSSYVLFWSVEEFRESVTVRNMRTVINDAFHIGKKISDSAIKEIYSILVKDGAIEDIAGSFGLATLEVKS